MASWFLCMAVITGCNGGTSAVKPPDIDPAGAATAAIAQYDRNSDGALSAEEVQDSALSLERWDADQNGTISEDEIEKRLAAYGQYGTGMVGVHCIVRQGRAPLENAKVTLVPEDFLGGAVQPAYGTTGSDGMANLSVAEEIRPRPDVHVMQIGLYTVEITHPDVQIESITPNAYELAPGENVVNPVFEVNNKPGR
jgi:hypothetical protein